MGGNGVALSFTSGFAGGSRVYVSFLPYLGSAPSSCSGDVCTFFLTPSNKTVLKQFRSSENTGTSTRRVNELVA